MCLFPIGGPGSGNPCEECLKPSFPATERANTMRTTMKVVMVVELLLGITRGILEQDAMIPFWDLFNVLFLWCGLSRLDYCNVLIYMMFMLMLAFQLAVKLCFMA